MKEVMAWWIESSISPLRKSWFVTKWHLSLTEFYPPYQLFLSPHFISSENDTQALRPFNAFYITTVFWPSPSNNARSKYISAQTTNYPVGQNDFTSIWKYKLNWQKKNPSFKGWKLEQASVQYTLIIYTNIWQNKESRQQQKKKN